MNQKQKPNKKRGATVAAVLCFVAVIALVGTYTFNGYRGQQREEKLAQADEAKDRKMKDPKEQDDSEAASTDAKNIVINTADDGQNDKDSKNEEKESQNDAQESTDIGLQPASAGGNAAYFDGSGTLLWPVNGAVILSYNMETPVYFSTLDQYKYNPAVIIAGAEGDQVICGAPGIVKSIDVTAETGTTVNIDIGNGYELFYGQLKEVPVQVGQAVEAKTVLGYVSQPTKYYSVEGPNVYFEMRKDGQPVNPVEFME